MDGPTTTIVLRGGPSDGEEIREVSAAATVYNRVAHQPDARYLDSRATDPEGRRIFDYVSLPPRG